MKKIIPIIFLLSLVSIMVPGKVNALSCVMPPPIQERFELYDAVVIAKVEDIKNKGLNNEITIDISKSYKGIKQKVITMKEMADWGTSKIGEEYLFFLQRVDDRWINSACGTSILIEHADVELKFLENIEKSKKRNAIIMYSSAIVIIAGVLILYFKWIRKYK